MSPLENRRILVVDDEKEIRNGYRKILVPEEMRLLSSSRVQTEPDASFNSTRNFEIAEAENGEQALEILLKAIHEGKPFAGAFVDVRMPGQIDGLQFIQQSWKNDPNLLIVVVTAYQDRSVDEIHRMFSDPFQDQWDYLNKPFSSGEIIQKARYIISSWNRRAREKEYIRKIQEHQEALIATERLAAVGKLARSVGHEFGNILQPLLGVLDIAQEQIKAGQTENLDSMIEDMIEAVALGATICQDLLTFSRETLTHSSDPSNIHSKEGASSLITVEDTVGKALRLLRHEIKKRDVHVTQNFSGEIEIYINEPKLVQVLVNLLKNALDAVPDGGKIEIQGRSEEQHLILEIIDNGTGIRPEDLSQLFQPLFSTKGKRGNGLGLAACKKIVEGYNGKISISSEYGRGTTVRVEFPA